MLRDVETGRSHVTGGSWTGGGVRAMALRLRRAGMINENHSQAQWILNTIRAVRTGPSVAVVAGPDAPVLALHRKPGDRLVGRGAQGAAVADVELRPVQHALDGACRGLEHARGQLEVLVAADVFQRVELAV